MPKPKPSTRALRWTLCAGARHGDHIQLLGELATCSAAASSSSNEGAETLAYTTISLCEALATCLMSADELRTKAGPYGYVPGACRSNAVAFGASVE